MSLLARAGGGAFIESTSSELARVFTRIEAGLTSADVIHYRSLAPLGHRVVVSVSVDGIPQAVTLSYTSPPAPRALGAKRVRPKSFWVTTTALVVFAGAAALLVGLALFVFLGPLLRRGGLRRRVGEFTVGGPLAIPEAVDKSTASPLPALERVLERSRWWPQFKLEVEIARIARSPVELVAFTAAGTIAVALLLGLTIGTPVPSILALVFGPLGLRSFVKQRLQKQRHLFGEQLPVNLQELASAMRAGHSLVSGITMIAEEAPEPSRSEWTRVVADEPMRPLRGPRLDMDTEGIAQVALVAALHQRTGGNMAEVLERVAESVRERAELRRELHALTAQARISRYIVTLLPLAVSGAIFLLNPEYLDPLFHTTTGVTLLFIAAGLLVGASLAMRRITEVKV